jgi:hypothetical protein
MHKDPYSEAMNVAFRAFVDASYKNDPHDPAFERLCIMDAVNAYEGWITGRVSASAN